MSLYVAASSVELARRFAKTNGVAPANVHFITPGDPPRERRSGMTIYVVGEIGGVVAAEIHLLVLQRGARVRYVDVFDKIGTH